MKTSAKNVLITGGAKGLGAYLARHLHAQGHPILVLDRTPTENLAPDYRRILAEYMMVDLSDWAAVRECLSAIMETYEVDVLINNAAARSFRDFSAFDTAEIERTIQINFKTPVLLTHELLPRMRQNGYGRIVNIGSLSGFRGYASGSLYCSTKSALAVFSEALGSELAQSDDDATINAICPDSFRTREGNDLRRFKETMTSVARIIDDLLQSTKNGTVIPVASRRRLVRDTALSLRRHARWFLTR